MSLKYAGLCALFKVAEASHSIRSEDGGFQGDSLVKVCLYTLHLWILPDRILSNFEGYTVFLMHLCTPIPHPHRSLRFCPS